MNVRDLSLSSSLPVGGHVSVLVVLVLVASLAACGSGGASTATTVPATTVPVTTVPVTTVPVTTVPVTTASPSSTTPEPDVDAVIDERLAFLVGFLNDPADVTDDDLAEQFAPSFLAAISPAEVRAAVVEAAGLGTAPWTVGERDLTAAGGVVVLTSVDGVELTLVFELEPTGSRKIVAAQVVPGSVGAIEDAFAEPGTFEQVDTELDAVASRVSYAVFDAADGGCAVLRERDGEVASPTGSTFKLWVLATLARAVRDGEAAWDEEMAVDPALRSSPDGEIYQLADGTPVTLQRLAEAMISISDNTATDHLLARLGRPAIEATLAELGVSTTARNAPFLSTGELFKLKFVDPSLGDRYLALTGAEERRAFLDGEVAATPLPWIADPTWTGDPEVLGTPQRIDELEWFATPLDLCVTLNDLDALAGQPGLEPVASILEMNPGLPFPEGRWSTIRFKGGSEPGVVMFAYWLETSAGERRVVVASLSDTEVAFDENTAVVPVARLLALS